MEINITLENPHKRDMLFGPSDRHLKMIRDSLAVGVFAREGNIKLTGPSDSVTVAAAVVERLQKAIRENEPLNASRVWDAISECQGDSQSTPANPDAIDVYVAGRTVRPKTAGQRRYIEAIVTNDLTICTGPAGTGKTYLAVAVAVHMLKRQRAKRLILVRPAVEAGEKLGFLPGDMQAKVNPYLRPLFDSLHDMMEYEQIRRFMVNDLIEVIPLAFMRGRTLNDSVIILDEAQNTSVPQMLMFLTRMGHGSKMIVTGDASQVDLPDSIPSGLVDSRRRLAGLKGIAMIELEREDIVRHRLVQDIVQAYARDDRK